MRVRVYNKKSQSYFQSDVYALINTGYYEKRLVHVPSKDGGYVCFFDIHEKIEGKGLEVLINTITTHRPQEWIHRRVEPIDIDQVLPDFTGSLHKGVRFFEYIGFPWLLENPSILAKLLNGKVISYKGSIFEKNAVDLKLPGWAYVETSQDVEYLMQKTYGFHDSVLKTLNFTSGAYVDADNAMHPSGDLRQLSMSFDSQWCDSIEMVFEGVTALNLRPSGDYFFEDIYSSSIIIKDASLFFCDDGDQEWNENYEGTWVTAYGLRWRLVELFGKTRNALCTPNFT